MDQLSCRLIDETQLNFTYKYSKNDRDSYIGLNNNSLAKIIDIDGTCYRIRRFLYVEPCFDYAFNSFVYCVSKLGPLTTVTIEAIVQKYYCFPVNEKYVLVGLLKDGTEDDKNE